MSTGVESWSAESFAEMSAMSPFVGTEVILTVVVVVVLDCLANLADQG